MRTYLLAVLMLPCLVLLAGGESPPTALLVDTDFGSYVDDAGALALLLASPEVDVQGITTTSGDTDTRAWMVCRFLSMAQRKEIPVAHSGSSQPGAKVTELFQYRYHPAVLFNRTVKPVETDAVKLLHEKLHAQPRGCTILALGPLTNIGNLLHRYTDDASRINRLVLMGGRLGEGAAEWNIHADIKAAQIVFNSGIPLVVVPLEATEKVQMSGEQLQQLFATQTLLTQQLQLLSQLSTEQEFELFDVVAAATLLDDRLVKSKAVRLTVTDAGHTRVEKDGEPNATVILSVEAPAVVEMFLDRVTKLGKPTKPRELVNFTKTIERGVLPARVHAFEDYETQIEKRWWLVGRSSPSDELPPGTRGAMRSVLTLDFDDRQGDLETMYGAVIFNPVPGPPMGPRTRLSFRYRLQGTDQLRIQLYSLSNGYHRYLALKDLPQNKWQEATVDMTDMRRPDGSGGPLAEDERIDDIQFYVEPTAEVLIDDVVLYEAATDDEQQPFPQRIVFTGGFDTGKAQGEWPGKFTIVEHQPPLKWKAAASVYADASNREEIRVSLRGARPLGGVTKLRFRYRLEKPGRLEVRLANVPNKQYLWQKMAVTKAGQWLETTLEFQAKDWKRSGQEAFDYADEILFQTDQGNSFQIDDILAYEPDE